MWIYYNMTIGIKDESVFTPPQMCFKNASSFLCLFVFCLFGFWGFFRGGGSWIVFPIFVEEEICQLNILFLKFLTYLDFFF